MGDRRPVGDREELQADEIQTNGPQIQIKRTLLSDAVLERVYVVAQGMCPTPLAYAQLKRWVKQCPEFCVCFRAALEGCVPTPMGVVVMLPILKKFWTEILVGRIRESSIDPTTMFARDPGAEVGLHIFYMERFDTGSRQRNLGILALNAARIITEKKGWRLAGFSALTATSAGRAACSQVGFTPTGYEEIALTRRGDFGEANVNIIYLYPGGKVLGQNGYGQFHSKSEMVVRYESPFPASTIRSHL